MVIYSQEFSIDNSNKTLNKLKKLLNEFSENKHDEVIINKFKNRIDNNRITKVDWNHISYFICIYITDPEYIELRNMFLDNYSSKLNWDLMIENYKFNEKELIKYSNYIDWGRASYHQNLSEDLIEMFSKRINWRLIVVSQKLSERFIRKHYRKMSWKTISAFQDLSESFMEEFKDNIDWNEASIYQCMSYKFIKLFFLKITTERIRINDYRFLLDHKSMKVGESNNILSINNTTYLFVKDHELMSYNNFIKHVKENNLPYYLIKNAYDLLLTS